MKDIKIIHTSDIHGYLFSHNYAIKSKQGLLSFENHIQKLRENNHVLLIDSGDALQGSALTYYASKFKSQEKDFKNPIIEAFNNLKYDVFTFGNHDFNYGYDYLQKSLSSFKGQIISANINGITDIIDCKPYKIFTIENKKIAVIGLTTKAVPNWEKPENINGLTFNSIVETYGKYEQELLDNSDMIIVNYHGGFEADINNLECLTEKETMENEAAKLLKTYTSIDILLTGHQHLTINQFINDTLCMQPSCNGALLDEITLSPNLEIIKHTQIPAEQEAISNNKLINDYENQVQKYLNQPIGHFTSNLEITDYFTARMEYHPLANFINDMQLEITGADVSAMSIFNGAGFSEVISMRDVLRNSPFPNTLKVLEISLSDLKEILEVSASYFTIENNQIIASKKFTYPKAQDYNYDLFGGIKYTFDLTKEIGNRVTDIEFINKNIDPQKIKIVVTNFRASNFSWYPTYENKKVIKEIPIDMTELMVNYISEKKEITINREKLMTIKK